MGLIALLLLTVLAVVALIKSASPSSEGRRFRIVLFTFVVPFLIFFLDEIIGHVYLRTMCTLEGGYKVSKPVHTDGFYSYSPYSNKVFAGCAIDCFDALVAHKFSYFETDVRYTYPYFTNQQGVHRFFLVDLNSGKCSMEGQQTKNGWGGIPVGKCIAYTKLSEPASQYEVSKATMDFWDKSNKIGIGPFKLQRNYSYVKDRSSGKIVGSETTFSYWGGWVRVGTVGHHATSCPNMELSHNAIFEKIILPKFDSDASKQVGWNEWL